jgi:hypothetical protein
MKTVYHAANSRGTSYFGWLDSKHSFSFGRYFDHNRMGFGKLRVLNDDIVEPGMGFGTHPHDNMEIVSIPLEGALEHQDSTGNTEVINTGDVQIMSAGSGLTHSEYNHSKKDRVNFLQIWVFPKEMNIEPRYDQKTFNEVDRINRWQTVVAPDMEQAVWINQDAWFHLAHLEASVDLPYQLKQKDNGVYLFVLSGNVVVEGQTLATRDAIGIWEKEEISIKAESKTDLLLMEIPME